MANTHTTDIQVGDTYVFRGLTNQPTEDARLITIIGMSVEGNVSYRLDYDRSQNIGSVPLPTALLMIEQGIWHHTDAERRT